MFGFTRKTDYALVALGAMAKSNACSHSPMSARQIAKQYHLPQATLMQLLKTLHRAGLVNSTRGANGGYYLAVTPNKITLSTVLEAIEGPLVVLPCCDDEASAEPCVECQLIDTCPISDNMQRVNEMIAGFLHTIRLSDLLEPSPTTLSVPFIGKNRDAEALSIATKTEMSEK